MLTRGVYRIAGLTRIWRAFFGKDKKEPSRFETHKEEMKYLSSHPEKRHLIWNLQKLQNSMRRQIRRKMSTINTDPISTFKELYMKMK